MKKKSLMTAMGVALAAGLGMVSSPSGQLLIEQTVQPVQTTVKQNANRQARATQTQQRATQTQRVNTLTNPYMPFGGGGIPLYRNSGMSPKEYGIWLMMTGKDKYNKRRRKHWAKATA